MRSLFNKIIGPTHGRFSRLRLKNAVKFQNAFAREIVIDAALGYIVDAGITGDYLEFGVFEGRTLSAAYHLIQDRNLPMHLYGFDSFAGIPNSGEAETFRPGAFACSEQQVRDNLKSNRLDLSRVTLVPGIFRDSLTDSLRKSLPLTKAALVWIDCDIYEGALDALNWIVPYLQDGSVLFFDDWFCFRADPNKGEQRAFREWLDSHREFQEIWFQRFGWHGNSFIIRKRDPDPQRP